MYHLLCVDVSVLLNRINYSVYWSDLAYFVLPSIKISWFHEDIVPTQPFQIVHRLYCAMIFCPQRTRQYCVFCDPSFLATRPNKLHDVLHCVTRLVHNFQVGSVRSVNHLQPSSVAVVSNIQFELLQTSAQFV